MLSTLGCLVGPGVAGALGCVLLAGRTPVWFLGVLKARKQFSRDTHGLHVALKTAKSSNLAIFS